MKAFSIGIDGLVVFIKNFNQQCYELMLLKYWSLRNYNKIFIIKSYKNINKNILYISINIYFSTLSLTSVLTLGILVSIFLTICVFYW